MVRARAWCRVDLAGGTLDIWPLGLLHEGARTVNLALSLAVTVRLERRDRSWSVKQGSSEIEASSVGELASHPETALFGQVARYLDLPPSGVEIESASPRGGGLGASSALAIALLAAGEALMGRPLASPLAQARVARDLEARLMGLPTGVQDHFPALLGGALEILYGPGEPRIRGLDVDREALDSCQLVVYSGQSHFSAGKNWQVVRRRLDGDPAVIELFAGIEAAAREMPEALESGDFQRVGALVDEEWSWRRRLAEGVTTERIEELLALTRDEGAWGGKACGAGGGGCLVILCPPERRSTIASALRKAGAPPLDAKVAMEPLEVVTEG
jgi:D-glycero-alpha-D-manno-heptose-7-phosphate kinase